MSGKSIISMCWRPNRTEHFSHCPNQSTAFHRMRPSLSWERIGIYRNSCTCKADRSPHEQGKRVDHCRCDCKDTGYQCQRQNCEAAEKGECPMLCKKPANPAKRSTATLTVGQSRTAGMRFKWLYHCCMGMKHAGHLVFMESMRRNPFLTIPQHHTSFRPKTV